MKPFPHLIFDSDHLNIFTLDINQEVMIPQLKYSVELAISKVKRGKVYLGYRLSPIEKDSLLLDTTQGEIEIYSPQRIISPHLISESVDFGLQYVPPTTNIIWVKSAKEVVWRDEKSLFGADMTWIPLSNK